MTHEKYSFPERFPCFLCGDLIEIRIDKKNHPYWICDSCGIQSFIRKKTGIKKLESANFDPSLNKWLESGEYIQNSEIHRIKERIELIKIELNQSDGLFSLFNSEKIQYVNRLKSKLKALEASYLKKLNNC